MCIVYLTIAFLFVAASVYAQPTQPPRTTGTPGSLITPATEEPAVVGQEGCISTILSQTTIQSSNATFIVVAKRGRGRSFRDRHPGLFEGDTIIQSDDSGRHLPITIVNQREAEMVRKRFTVWGP